MCEDVGRPWSIGVVEVLSSSRITAGDSIIVSRTHLYKRQRIENISNKLFEEY